MKTEFITPVSMECTEDQYRKYLKEPLEKMGYKEEDVSNFKEFPILVNNHNDYFGCLGNISDYRKDKNNRYFIDNFNPELFLALASMTNNPEGNYGEYWVFRDERYRPIWTNGKLYKQMRNLNDWGAFIDDTGYPNGMHPDNFDYFRKATVEEIINFFSKQESKEKELIPEKGGYYYCKSKETGNEFIFISNGVTDYKTNRIVSFRIRSKRLNLDNCPGVIFNDDIEILRFATPEQKNILDSELLKQNKYFDKETMSIKEIKKENMKIFTTTRTNMQKIHAIACTTWQPIIIDLTNKYAISPFSEEIDLPEEEVQKMFGAATHSQIRTLNEVFPDYNEDKNIFIKNPTSDQIRDLNDALSALCQGFTVEICPDFTVEMVDNAGNVMNRPDLIGRGLYVSSYIKVIVHEVRGGSVIEFVEK